MSDNLKAHPINMPSLNADKLHKFTDITEAKPQYVRILYNNGIQYQLVPYGNYWRLLVPNELLNKLSIGRPRPRPPQREALDFIQNHGFF